MDMFGATALLGPPVLPHAELEGVCALLFTLPCAAHAVTRC